MDIEQLPAIPESLERGLWQREPAPALVQLSQKRQNLAWFWLEDGFVWLGLVRSCPVLLALSLLPPRFTYW